MLARETSLHSFECTTISLRGHFLVEGMTIVCKNNFGYTIVGGWAQSDCYRLRNTIYSEPLRQRGRVAQSGGLSPTRTVFLQSKAKPFLYREPSKVHGIRKAGAKPFPKLITGFPACSQKLACSLCGSPHSARPAPGPRPALLS